MNTTEHQDETEFSCIIQEYNAIKQETYVRLQGQQNLFNYTVVLICATLPAASYIMEKQQYTLLLVIPLVFVLLGWLLLEQENMIDSCGQYINLHLAPKMEQFLSRGRNQADNINIWEWELYLYQYSSYERSWFKKMINIILGISRFTLPVLPGLASLLLFWWLASSNTIKPEDIVLTIVDSLSLIFLIISAITLKSNKPRLIQQRKNMMMR